MSLCLCTSALNFYVCDLPHCVNGVCGHTNHLVCPEQLLFRHSYNNHSVRAISAFSQTGAGITMGFAGRRHESSTGELVRVQNIQVQQKHHVAMKG